MDGGILPISNMSKSNTPKEGVVPCSVPNVKSIVLTHAGGLSLTNSYVSQPPVGMAWMPSGGFSMYDHVLLSIYSFPISFSFRSMWKNPAGIANLRHYRNAHRKPLYMNN